MTRARALTNRVAGVRLLEHLKNELPRATSVSLIISFLMESGAKALAAELRGLAERKVPIRILTGDYLRITEPSALYLLRSLLRDHLDLRVFAGRGVSFHPKAYFLDLPEGPVLYVGSSNLSRSALTSGVEWNFRLPRSSCPEEFDRFRETFDGMFLHESMPATDEWLRTYSETWKETAFNRAEEIPVSLFPENEPQSAIVAQPAPESAFDPRRPLPFMTGIQPRGAQIEALYYLERAREEGVSRGLVIAATGVGKTFLAAFDSRSYRRVLFVAHREEILQQAAASFQKVRPDSSIGFFMGRSRDADKDLVFATVQTIGRRDVIEKAGIAPDSFDYIVVDEFHHAATTGYRKVLEYFRPNFLLGLTATPYRMDQQDIFALCGDQVVYEIHLQEAINRGLLCPFRYFAVYDETVDYTTIEFRNGRYDQQQLERGLSRPERANLVLERFRQYAGDRVLAFSAGIRHAEFMAEYFRQNKIRCGVVHSQPSTSPCKLERQEALEKLRSGEIRVLFSVDLFNEGVDAPLIDTVLFLRPTDSYTVFLQQLGRGLRKAENKPFLTVLDFIGNYRRAHHIPLLLSGKNPMEEAREATSMPHKMMLPEGCIANFDFRLIDLFTKLRQEDPLPVRLKDEVRRLHQELGRRPDRSDLLSGSDIPLRGFLGYGEKGWLQLLDELEMLLPEEREWLQGPVPQFLQRLEKTSMAMSFKVPTILAFLTEAGFRGEVTADHIVQAWRDFYGNPRHLRDMAKHGSTRDFATWNDSLISRHAWNNPVKFLCKSESTFFGKDETRKVFYLQPVLHPFLSPALGMHVRDILQIKTLAYFARKLRGTDPESKEEK